MKCANCGKEFDDTLAECPHCLGGLDQSEAAQTAREQEVEQVHRQKLRLKLKSTHLIGAVLATLFCCMPFGVVAIVYAGLAEGKLMDGDVRKARILADKADGWLTASILLGMVWIFLIALVVLLGGLRRVL